jgi:hypothetical protein
MCSCVIAAMTRNVLWSSQLPKILKEDFGLKAFFDGDESVRTILNRYLRNAINGSRIALLVISNRFNKSDYCLQESNSAIQRYNDQYGITLIPVFLNESGLRGTISTRLGFVDESHGVAMLFFAENKSVRGFSFSQGSQGVLRVVRRCQECVHDRVVGQQHPRLDGYELQFRFHKNDLIRLLLPVIMLRQQLQLFTNIVQSPQYIGFNPFDMSSIMNRIFRDFG